jgi:hypothetical protein
MSCPTTDVVGEEAMIPLFKVHGPPTEKLSPAREVMLMFLYGFLSSLPVSTPRPFVELLARLTMLFASLIISSAV